MTITAEPPRVALPVTHPPHVRALRYEPPPRQPWPIARPAPAASAVPRSPAPGSAAEDPDVRGDGLHHVAQAVLRLMLEVLDGRRPVAQLDEHLTRPALRCVRAAGCRGSGRSRLTSMRVCRPAPDAEEVAAVYRLDGRARAVAARFERTRDGAGWRCVAVRLG